MRPKLTVKPSVIVGLSGGVDSSVSALLLKEQGYDVHGLFMKNWEEDDTTSHCAAKADLDDVKKICRTLKIPLHTVNFAQEYWEKVFSFFLDEYRSGRTPNPDILCNKEIKFKAFLEHARTLGADLIAMGHYAQNPRYGNDQYCYLEKGCDDNKDQTYFLYTLTQQQLSKSMFPIGHLEKSTVRLLAKEADLVTYNKKDSTGICFIGERKFKSFLSDFVLGQPGEIQDDTGAILGRHDGLMFYTLGQRQGLQIGGTKGKEHKPWYVMAKDVQNNILFITQDTEHPGHFSDKLIAHHVNWVAGSGPNEPMHCTAKVRYRQIEQECTVTLLDLQEMRIEFRQPQRAVTPGQSIVLYQGNYCLGGGIIHYTNSLGGILSSVSTTFPTLK